MTYIYRGLTTVWAVKGDCVYRWCPFERSWEPQSVPAAHVINAFTLVAKVREFYR